MTYSLPGVSTADGFALIYLKHLSLWSDADVYKEASWDENLFVAMEQSEGSPHPWLWPY